MHRDHGTACEFADDERCAVIMDGDDEFVAAHQSCQGSMKKAAPYIGILCSSEVESLRRQFLQHPALGPYGEEQRYHAADQRNAAKAANT